MIDNKVKFENQVLEYSQVLGHESLGRSSYGIVIHLAIDHEISDHEKDALSACNNLLTEAIIKTLLLNDPKTEENKKQIKLDFQSIFPDLIFMEEIPNEYHVGVYGIQNPWYLVTTNIGRFKIGWRKRVISIDWAQTLCKVSANNLFVFEDTTKIGYEIHAWNLEKAKEYILEIFNNIGV